MPASYDDSYECLKNAQEGIEHLHEKTTAHERRAGLRVIFGQIYQAARIACMCYEVSNHEGSAAQGGFYAQTKEELYEFLQAMKWVCSMADTESPEEFESACLQWLQRAKGFVERIRSEEARATNMQFARIPD